jgi:hypothetical protein
MNAATGRSSLRHHLKVIRFYFQHTTTTIVTPAILFNILDAVFRNRQTNAGENVSLTRRLHFNPRMIPGTHFCQTLSRPQTNSAAAGKIRLSEKSQSHWQ